MQPTMSESSPAPVGGGEPENAVTTANDDLSRLESAFDGLMVRLLDLTSKQGKDDSKLKSCISALYTVFVDILGQATELQVSSSRKDARIEQLQSKLDVVTSMNAAYEEKLQSLVQDLGTKYSTTNVPSEESGDITSNVTDKSQEVAKQLEELNQNLSQSRSWKTKVDLYDEKITKLENEITSMKKAENDLLYSNHALKSELCGRIQQLQLISKGMATPGDKVYTRILSEMEQNSMKAYAQHARKTGRASVVPAPKEISGAKVNNDAPGPSSAKKQIKMHKRTVTITKGESGYGLTISGSPGGKHILVHSVRPGGAAALSGQVFVKDIIVAINGKEVKHFAGHDEMVAEITTKDCAVLELLSRMPDKDTAPVVNEVKDRRTVTISKSNGSFGLKVGEGSNGHVRVFGVIPGGAAEKLGIVSLGDRILAVDGVQLKRASNRGFLNLMKGKDKVELLLEPDSSPCEMRTPSPEAAPAPTRTAKPEKESEKDIEKDTEKESAKQVEKQVEIETEKEHTDPIEEDITKSEISESKTVQEDPKEDSKETPVTDIAPELAKEAQNEDQDQPKYQVPKETKAPIPRNNPSSETPQIGAYTLIQTIRPSSGQMLF
eukprot:m.337424 g.337424  ORF g.337424 m.337424 type:complete len:607 (-) comp18129_c0_seq1:45-1865(-)